VLNAHHFRSQAELYLELARRMSLRGDAEYCRIIAERCVTRAIELETHSDSVTALRDIPSARIPDGS
jgi:hypothetical protein